MPYIRDQPGLRRTNKGPRGTNQDPAIRIRVIWDGSGPAGPIKTPEWIGPRGTYQCPKWTSQGPVGRIMGPMGKTKAPQDESGPCWTDQAQMGLIQMGTLSRSTFSVLRWSRATPPPDLPVGLSLRQMAYPGNTSMQLSTDSVRKVSLRQSRSSRSP